MLCWFDLRNVCVCHAACSREICQIDTLQPMHYGSKDPITDNTGSALTGPRWNIPLYTILMALEFNKPNKVLVRSDSCVICHLRQHFITFTIFPSCGLTSTSNCSFQFKHIEMQVYLPFSRIPRGRFPQCLSSSGRLSQLWTFLNVCVRSSAFSTFLIATAHHW